MQGNHLIKRKRNTKTSRAGLKGGQRGQLPRALRSKGAPRDDNYLFQIKYSFGKSL